MAPRSGDYIHEGDLWRGIGEPNEGRGRPYKGQGAQFRFTKEAFYDPLDRHEDGEHVRMEPSVLLADEAGEPSKAREDLERARVPSNALAGLSVADILAYTHLQGDADRVTATGSETTPLKVRFSPTEQLPAHAVIESVPEWQATNYPKKLKKRLAALATAWFHRHDGWVLPPPDWTR